VSKAIEGAALLGVAAGIFIFAPELAPFIAPETLNTLFFAFAAGGVSMELGALADALTSNRGTNITTRQAAAYRQIIYGEQRVGGVEIYRSSTGDSHNHYNYVIVLAGHECDSIVNLYLDGRLVHWNVGSPGNSTRNGVNFGGYADPGTFVGPGGQNYTFGSEVWCEARYGDQAPGDVIVADVAPDPAWAASTGGTPWVGGCTYVYLNLGYDTNTFPGEPEIRFTVRGKNDIYDPRDGSTGYSNNWALCVANAITDTQYGLGDVGSVNTAQLIAAANVCDESIPMAVTPSESRYTLNWHYDTSVSPGDVINNMMPAAGGRLSRIGGEWYIWPAYWQGPSFTLTDDSILGDIKWDAYRDFGSLVNRVSGTYIAPNYPYNVAGNLYDSNGWYDHTRDNTFPFAFQPTNFPTYACDTLHGYAGGDEFLAADGGVILPMDLSLNTVLSIGQAQRLAKIALLRNRQQGKGTFLTSLAAWQLQPTDVLQMTFPAHGWVNKMMEVQSVKLVVEKGNENTAPYIMLQVEVAETDPSVYAWASTEELSPYDVPVANQIPFRPAPPTGMALNSGPGYALVGLDGTVTPRIAVSWSAPLDILVKQIQIQYQLTGASVWTDSGLCDVGNFIGYISPVVANGTYNVRIRSLRANGATSVWVEMDSYVVGTSLSIYAYGGGAVAPPGTLSAQGLSDGTAQITVIPFTATIGSLALACTPSPAILTGLAQSQLYGVYFDDPSFTSGVITPVATQNPADYTNVYGRLLIGKIVTPSYTPRYQPSTSTDLGSSTTTTPAAAYDNDITTNAIVKATWWVTGSYPSWVSNTSSGSCIWSGFLSITTTAPMTLHVVASASASSSLASWGGTIVATVAGVDTTLLSTGVDVAEADYSMTIPTGTALNTITVHASVSVTGGTPTGGAGGAGVLQGFEIYIQ